MTSREDIRNDLPALRVAKSRIPKVAEEWPGIIVCCGPEGEDEQPDYADNRYWVKKAKIVNDDWDEPIELEALPTVATLIGQQSPAEFEVGEIVTQERPDETATGVVLQILLDDDDHTNDRLIVRTSSGEFAVHATCQVGGPSGGRVLPTAIESDTWVMASNDGENVEETHWLEHGQYVTVRAVRDATDPKVKRYVFTLMPLAAILFMGGTLTSGHTLITHGAAAWKSGMWQQFISNPRDDGPFSSTCAEYYAGKLWAGGNFVLGNAPFEHTEELIYWANGAWHAAPEGHGLDDIDVMLVWDDGTGEALYVGGTGGVSRWNGVSWRRMAVPNNRYVYDLCVWDDGTGARLYAATDIYAGWGVCKWTGASWSKCGTFSGSGWVNTLCVHDDGGGERLYAGGDFSAPGGLDSDNVARWNGSAWEAVGAGLSGATAIMALASLDDGEQCRLYAGGTGCDDRPLWCWTGHTWHVCGDVLLDQDNGSLAVGTINTLVAHGKKLVVGGGFVWRALADGGLLRRVATLVDDDYYAELDYGVNATVHALAFYDGALIAGGTFTREGHNDLRYIGVWNAADEEWAELGEACNGAVYALAIFDEDLYAAGDFTGFGDVETLRIARWNGSQWAAVGVINGPVYALLTNDAGTMLWIAGHFDRAGGQAGHLCLTSWDGDSWAALITDIEADDDNPAIRALVQDGTDLYVGGNFCEIEGVSCNNVARYDINLGTWHACGGGVDGVVRSIAVHDGKIYVGGEFTTIEGGTPCDYIAAWDSNTSTWTATGASNPPYWMGPVTVMTSHGGALYVGCYGTQNSWYDEPSWRVRKLESGSWEKIGGDAASVSDEILAVVFGDAGTGDRMYIGGRFTSGGDDNERHNVPASRLILYDPLDNYQPMSGGAGASHIQGTGVVNAGPITRVVRRRFDGDRCSSLLVCGPGMREYSQHYTPMIARATRRGVVPLQGGLHGGGGTVLKGVWAVCRSSTDPNQAYVAGNFSHARNTIIAPEDIDDVDEWVSANMIAHWDGRYWRAMGNDFSGSYAGYAICEHDGTVYAAPMIGTVQQYTGGSWVVLDDRLNGVIHAIAYHDGLLWIAGEDLTHDVMGSVVVVVWDGETMTDRSPASLFQGLSFCVADVDGEGEKIYLGGLGSQTHGVLRWNGADWSAVGSGLEAEVTSLTAVTCDDGVTRLFALLSTSAIYGYDANTNTWSQIAEMWGSGEFGAICAAGTKLFVVGGFRGLIDWDGDDIYLLDVPGVAMFDPVDRWSIPAFGGHNGHVLAGA